MYRHALGKYVYTDVLNEFDMFHFLMHSQRRHTGVSCLRKWVLPLNVTLSKSKKCVELYTRNVIFVFIIIRILITSKGALKLTFRMDGENGAVVVALINQTIRCPHAKMVYYVLPWQSRKTMVG